MTVLVVGASGATGRLLVKQLLDRGESVRVIVRSSHGGASPSPDGLPESLRESASLSVVVASVLALSDAELVQQVDGCRAIASCLGHNVTLQHNIKITAAMLAHFIKLYIF